MPNAKLFCFPLRRRRNDSTQLRQILCGDHVLFQSMHNIRSEQIWSHFDANLLQHSYRRYNRNYLDYLHSLLFLMT